jgi:peptidoglycan/LPS O-acetylase OafA/YrhL
VLPASRGLPLLEWQRNRAGIERWGVRMGAVLAVLGFAGLGLLGLQHISTIGNSRIGNIFIYEFSLLICLGFMLYALSGWRVGWLQLRPLQYVGRISYSMYLVHLGIITLIMTRLRGAAGAAIALVLTIGYAALSWHLIESPLLGWKAKSDAIPEAVSSDGVTAYRR